RLRTVQSRARDWTVLSLGAPASVPASPIGSNAPAGMPALPGFRDLVSRIERDHAPFPPSATNFWLNVDGLDLGPLANALGLSKILPVEPPKLSLTLIGDGKDVATRGHFDLAKSVP